MFGEHIYHSKVMLILPWLKQSYMVYQFMVNVNTFFFYRLNNYISNFYVLKWTNTIGSEVGIIKNSITNKVLLAFTGVGFQFSTIFFPNLLLRFYNITNHLTNSILIPESFTSSIVAIPLYWYDSCKDLYMDLESVFPLDYGNFPPTF